MKSIIEQKLAAIKAAQSKWAGAEARLLALRKYEHGWDGEDAEAVPSSLITSISIWFRKMRDNDEPAPDAVVPTFGGTVMMEWFKADGSVTSAEVRTEGRAEMLDWQPDRSKTFRTARWTAAVAIDTPIHSEVRAEDSKDEYESTAMATFIALAA